MGAYIPTALVHTYLRVFMIDQGLALCVYSRGVHVITVVSLCVCLCVCYQSTDFLRCLYNKRNIPARFRPISKGFQLRDGIRSRVTASFVHFIRLGFTVPSTTYA